MNLVNEGVLPPNELDDRDERREEREMAQERETLADIVAEMRTRSREVKEAFGGRPDGVENMLDIWADRIEAAWKREREHVGKTDMLGNMAKMREALEYVLQFDATDEAAEQDGLTDAERIAEYADHISECQKKARAALSEPPRQCDRLSAEQCKKIFKMGMGIYLPQEATDRDRDIARCTAYGVIDAPFAPSDAPFEPSTHRKGEGDGR